MRHERGKQKPGDEKLCGMSIKRLHVNPDELRLNINFQPSWTVSTPGDGRQEENKKWKLSGWRSEC